MEIKWDGKELDFVLDVTLRAIILKDGTKAVVVKASNQDSPKNILRSFGLNNVECISFIFNPDRALNSMDYILATDDEKKEYEKLANEFCDAFYQCIVELAKKEEKLLRAHQLKLLWKKFNHVGSEIEEKKFQFEAVEGDVKGEVNKIKKRSEREIKRYLTNLVIQFTVYIAVWEKSYCKDDIAKVKYEDFCRLKNEKHKIELNKKREETRISANTRRQVYADKYKDIKEYIEVDKKTEKQNTKKMYSEIHKRIGVPQGIDSSEVDFFYKGKEDVINDNFTLCRIIEITKLVDVSLYENRVLNASIQVNRKKLFSNLVVDKKYEQIDFKLCELLEIGVEIVIFNLIRFNGKILHKDDEIIYADVNKESEWFFEYADRMRVLIIPYLYFVIDCSEQEEGQSFDLMNVFWENAIKALRDREKYSILDKSNWGLYENKEESKKVVNQGRHYWKARTSYFSKCYPKRKYSILYLKEELRKQFLYSAKDKRYIFLNDEDGELAKKYESFIKETGKSMMFHIRRSLQRWKEKIDEMK